MFCSRSDGGANVGRRRDGVRLPVVIPLPPPQHPPPPPPQTSAKFFVLVVVSLLVGCASSSSGTEGEKTTDTVTIVSADEFTIDDVAVYTVRDTATSSAGVRQSGDHEVDTTTTNRRLTQDETITSSSFTETTDSVISWRTSSLTVLRATMTDLMTTSEPEFVAEHNRQLTSSSSTKSADVITSTSSTIADAWYSAEFPRTTSRRFQSTVDMQLFYANRFVPKSGVDRHRFNNSDSPTNRSRCLQIRTGGGGGGGSNCPSSDVKLSQSSLPARTPRGRYQALEFCSDYSVYTGNSVDNYYCGWSSSACWEWLDGVCPRVIRLDHRARVLSEHFNVMMTSYDCKNRYSTIWNCSACKDAYKDWLCAALLTISDVDGALDPSSCSCYRHHCARAAQLCPYLSPHADVQYAGEPAFFCTGDDDADPCDDDDIPLRHRDDVVADTVCTVRRYRHDSAPAAATPASHSSTSPALPPDTEYSTVSGGPAVIYRPQRLSLALLNWFWFSVAMATGRFRLSAVRIAIIFVDR